MSFMTGVWKKKSRTAADMVKFYHNPTVHQLNFLHEIANQHLGHAPSTGHSVMPWQFQNVAPETWNYIRGATRQPAHEFARLMTSSSADSKKASGITTDILDVLGSAGRTAVKYGTKVIGGIIKHQDSIRTGVKVTKDIVDLGSLIANLTGLTSDDTHKRVQAVTGALDKTVSRYGKKPPKKGGSWYDYDSLL